MNMCRSFPSWNSQSARPPKSQTRKTWSGDLIVSMQQYWENPAQASTDKFHQLDSQSQKNDQTKNSGTYSSNI